MFELSAQFEYLMRDPATRAQQYLDFAHVTRHKLARDVVFNADTPISKAIAESPLRAAGELHNKAEFDRVRDRFRRGKQTWDKWYCRPLRDLAREIGWAAEYKHWYAIGSAWAHGDAFFAGKGYNFGGHDGEILFGACCTYLARMLFRVSDKIVLTKEQYELLNTFKKPLA